MNIIPRTHSLLCPREDFPEVKRELESKGYVVYDPLMSGNTACITYIRSEDINSIALQAFTEGDYSD